MTAFVDTPSSLLNVNDVVRLDGKQRAVLATAPGDVTGFRYLLFEGFTAPLHVGDHWTYSAYPVQPSSSDLKYTG